MLSRAARRSRIGTAARYLSTSASSSRSTFSRRNGVLAVVLGAGGLAGAAILSPVYADILENGDMTTKILLKSSSKAQNAVLAATGKNELDTFTWGNNANRTVSADKDAESRRPTPFTRLSGPGIALRDLAFSEKHAACVDAAGNLYQWGDGFIESETSDGERGPQLTLKGKDIVKIVLSSAKVYALSKSGKVYVVSADKKKQPVTASTPGMTSSWWDVSRFWRSKPSVDYVELHTDAKLHSSERIASITAGSSHLLTLTTSCRTFATPVSSSANSYGQLGVRKVLLPSPLKPSQPTPVEFIPKSVKDPFANATPAIRTISPAPSSTAAVPPKEAYDETDIRWCDKLFEVPALKGVEIAQVVAGDRTSYARTKSGRVLGWGANEYGQLALGGHFTLESVAVPTEIVLSRSYPGGTSVECLDIAAGGDVVYFTTQTSTPTAGEAPSIAVDLLAAGMGQYGSLGNNTFVQSQGSPVKVKVISGVQEYDETTKSVVPLAPRTVSASPTGHAIVVLDTFGLDGNVHQEGREAARKGRDVMVWGANSDFQLGLGKRSNIPLPTPLPARAFIGGFDVDDKLARMMTRERKVDVLRDLQGHKVAKNVKVEQTAVAGWGCSAVYWKVA